jgi:hypothetical protein
VEGVNGSIRWEEGGWGLLKNLTVLRDKGIHLGVDRLRNPSGGGWVGRLYIIKRWNDGVGGGGEYR